MASSKSAATRLAFVDWVRGLAAITMINGHAFHSFTAPEHRDGAAFVLTQFIGGMPPAVFLFLLGVTLAFRMDSRERKGVAAAGRLWSGLRQAGFLLGAAFLFRLQLFLFGWPGTSWQDLFKVDILNAMGMSVAVLSVLAVPHTRSRVTWGALAGAAIAFASPLVSALDWSAVPGPVRAYLVPNRLAFAFFPWAAFVAFGISAGSILRLVPRENLDRVMQWAALAGFALIAGGRYCANLPYSLYSQSDFWADGPWLILIKLGVVLLVSTAAYLWTQYAAGPGWSWVRQFGTTSMLVYWVHTELVYGRWLWFWKESLNPYQCAAAGAGVILLMLGLSLVRTNWRSFKISGIGVLWPAREPQRVPGD